MTFPRMSAWALLTAALFLLTLYIKDAFPGSLLAVSLYKAHLMALAGWAGYWLDRALFPYDRPHCYLEPAEELPADQVEQIAATCELVDGPSFQLAMLRRAVIVAACLICVALGA